MYAGSRELVNRGFSRFPRTLPNAGKARNPTGDEPRMMKEATAFS